MLLRGRSEVLVASRYVKGRAFLAINDDGAVHFDPSIRSRASLSLLQHIGSRKRHLHGAPSQTQRLTAPSSKLKPNSSENDVLQDEMTPKIDTDATHSSRIQKLTVLEKSLDESVPTTKLTLRLNEEQNDQLRPADINSTSSKLNPSVASADTTTAEVSSNSTENKSLWMRAKRKFIVVKGFFGSYLEGISLFAQELRLAVRLARRVYWERHRYSRRERLQLKQCAADLAKLLPITSMFMVLGMEISTFAILRFVPGLMPNTLRRTVEPHAQKLGIADPDKREKELSIRRLEIVEQISQITHAYAAKRLDHDGVPEVARFLESLENGDTAFSTNGIESVAKAFREHMSMDKLPREQLVHLAALHLPNSASTFLPRIFLARRLRHHVQVLRQDDKEIHWEGIERMNDHEIKVACEQRGLVEGSAHGRVVVDPLVLRHRLETWLRLSLNREIPSSLLLVSCALMMRDQLAKPAGVAESQTGSFSSAVADSFVTEQRIEADLGGGRGVHMQEYNNALTGDTSTTGQTNRVSLLVEQEARTLKTLQQASRELDRIRGELKELDYVAGSNTNGACNGYIGISTREKEEVNTTFSATTKIAQSILNNDVKTAESSNVDSIGEQAFHHQVARSSYSRAQEAAGLRSDQPIPFSHHLVDALMDALSRTRALQKTEGTFRNGFYDGYNGSIGGESNRSLAGEGGRSDVNARHTINELLPQLDQNADGSYDYADFLKAYEELRRRQEDRQQVEQRREALIRLSQMLDRQADVTALEDAGDANVGDDSCGTSSSRSGKREI